MKKIIAGLTHLNDRPVLTGLFTVVLTVTFGMSIALATGLVTPSQALAEFFPPCCTPPVVVTPPIVITPPVIIGAPLLPPSCKSFKSVPSRLPYGGGEVTLSWKTELANSLSINQGVGSVSPVSSGSVTVTVTEDTRYKLTVSGTGGETTCDTEITVSPPPEVPQPPKPLCELQVSPGSVVKGMQAVLSWVTENAATFVIDHGVGSVPIVEKSSAGVFPTETTTYTGVATSAAGETKTCTATVSVTEPPVTPDAPVCTLTANKTSIATGESVTLSWTTTRANGFAITPLTPDLGFVNTVSQGSVSVTPTETTTYTGTARGGGGISNPCPVTITVTPPPTSRPPRKPSNPRDLVCTLTANKTTVNKGEQAVLHWITDNVTSFSIDHGVGVVKIGEGSAGVSPTETTTYTGTARGVHADETITCPVTITVTTPPTSCTSNCGGGGGGGGSPKPKVVLSAVPHIGTVAGSYIYLSQVPYTGLELGPTGTILYWVGLVGWSLALAYLVLFGVVPFAGVKIRSFGERVSAVVNERESAPIYVAPVMHAVSKESSDEAEEAPRGYSTFDGFKSFAKNEALSIEDIVKGLARSHTAAPVAKTEPVYEHVEPVYDRVEPIRENVEVFEKAAAQDSVQNDVHGFTTALVQGDRAGVFTSLREHMRGSGAPEKLLTAVVCLLDDVYRARIDGTPCDQDIARVTARLTTPVLEKLIASLTTAIDSSYSTNVTGAKLALTRALSTLGA